MHSEAWTAGYKAAFAEWQLARVECREPDFDNKFPIGTDEEEGFEAGVYEIENPKYAGEK